MTPRAATYLAERDPAEGALPSDRLSYLSVDELRHELAEIETALAKATSNLDLARVDHRRWTLVLARVEHGAAEVRGQTPEDERARAGLLRELRDVREHVESASQRVEGCRAALDALTRLEASVRARIDRDARLPSESAIWTRPPAASAE